MGILTKIPISIDSICDFALADASRIVFKIKSIESKTTPGDNKRSNGVAKLALDAGKSMVKRFPGKKKKINAKGIETNAAISHPKCSED